MRVWPHDPTCSRTSLPCLATALLSQGVKERIAPLFWDGTGDQDDMNNLLHPHRNWCEKRTSQELSLKSIASSLSHRAWFVSTLAPHSFSQRQQV